MPKLTLQTPSWQDQRAMAAAASDPQAQHWLGWSDHFVQQARQWTRLLEMEPTEGGRVLRTPHSPEMHIAVVDPWARRLAGSVYIDSETGEIGGYLAPGFRGRGLGSALFAGAAEVAHHHLGLATVLAGTEPENVACIRALSAAGFTPIAGSATHTLPNGRVVAARWFGHESVRPARCPRGPFTGPASRRART